MYSYSTTVTLEIFVRVYFLQNFADLQSFMKIKPSQNSEVTLSFNKVGISCPSCEFFNVANMSFIAIRENKILAKISEFTVFNREVITDWSTYPQIYNFSAQSVPLAVQGSQNLILSQTQAELFTLPLHVSISFFCPWASPKH